MAVRDMVAIAQSQLGNSGYKYYTWYGFNYRVDWCAIFMSWCANEAGYNLVDTSTITSDTEDFPRYAVVGYGAEWFQNNHRLQPSPYYGGNYIPKKGDIAFFSWINDPPRTPARVMGLDHTGIVESYANGVVTTIEGNSGDRVKRQTYGINESYIAYYGLMDGVFGSVSDLVIAAICGNFWRESTVNAGIWESLIVMPWDYIYNYSDPNKGGYGIGGFTNTQGPYGADMRLLRMHDWCVNNGYAVDDGNAQLYYIVFVERLWAGHYQNDDFDAYLASTETDLYTLVDQWCRYWEGVPGNAMTERFAYAQQAYDYIQQHKTDDPSTYHWVAGNRFLTQSETLNNVMCLYFWFKSYYTPSDDGGGGGSKRKGKSPIWMMLRSPVLY